MEASQKQKEKEKKSYEELKENFFTFELEKFHKSGNLVLEDNETLRIEKKRISVNGDIILRDNSSLIVSDSLLSLNISFSYEHKIHIRDNSAFKVQNSIIGQELHPSTDIAMESNNASLKIENTLSARKIVAKKKGKIKIYSSKIKSTICWHAGSDSHVEIENSKVQRMMLSLLVARGNDKKIHGLKSGFNRIVDFKPEDGGYLKAKKTNIGRWVLDFNGIWVEEEQNITVKNTHFGGIWFWFGKDTFVKMEDFKEGYYEKWVLQEEAETDNVSQNLTLENVRIGGPNVGDIKLMPAGKGIFENMEDIQVCPRNGSTTIVRNSEISWPVVLSGNRESLKIVDSVMRDKARFFFLIP